MNTQSNETFELEESAEVELAVAGGGKISPAPKKAAKNSLKRMSQKQLIFCIVMAAIPLLQFFIFYICVNFNSFLLAFRRENLNGDMEWGWFHFKELFEQFKLDKELFTSTLKNSFIAFFFTTVLQIPLTLLFAYYVFKKSFGGKFFKIMLFLPSVVTSIVLVLIYKYFADRAIPIVINKLFNKEIEPLYSSIKTQFASILLYSVIMSFGSNVLMFLSSMNSVNESMLEAARLDGANYFQEFFHIILPMCYPTMVTFFVIGISGIFTNQLNMVAFFGTESPPKKMQTFGYYMFQQVAKSGGESNYPRLSAMGLIITAIVVPLTLLVKKTMEKLGPRTEA